jgi:hypothetical protein
MPRLSIIIPAVSTVEALESTLVSVLQNRPADAEVIVVLGHKYADPYSLSGEVEFLQAPAKGHAVAAANLGVQHARAPIVHVLFAGCEVQDGWSDSAVRQFANPKVAAVAPAIYDRLGHEQLLAIGAELGWAGSRRIILAGRDEKFPKLIHAPLSCAGFYRRELWQTLGGFDASAGHCADVLLGMLFKAADAKVYADLQSVVYAPHDLALPPISFKTGLYAQRLALGLSREIGWTRLLAQPGQILAETLASLRGIGCVTSLLGRAIASLQWPTHGGIRARMAQAHADIEALPVTGPTLLRVDSAHAASHKTETPQPRRKVG